MTRKPLAAALALGMAMGAQANEVMWMPTQLPDLAKPLQAAGFKGNPADLADLTKPVGGDLGQFGRLVLL